MIATKDPYIASAYQKLQVISQDKQKRLEYEAREKAIRDHNQLIYEANQRGEKRGEKRGIERINKLNTLLVKKKRYDELERSLNDAAYQQELLRKYSI